MKNLLLSSFFILTLNQYTYASPIIPSDGSKINILTINNDKIISGGLIKGKNLFLNFNKFNVNKNSNAIINKTNAELKNTFIIVRGNERSNIFGSLLFQDNLFLINRNGFNIGGRQVFPSNSNVYISTADKIRFQEGLYDSGRLLTNLPSSSPKELIFQKNRGKVNISNSGHNLFQLINLTSPNFGIGESTEGLFQRNGFLSISASNVTIDGGIITQNNGRVDLTAIKEGFIEIGKNPSAPSNFLLGNLDFKNKGLIDSSGENAEINILGNSININDESALIITNTSLIPSNKINIISNTLNVLGQNKPIERSRFQATRGIVSQTFFGRGADISIDSNTITLDKSGGIVAATFGDGDSGDININTDDLQLLGGSEFGIENFGSIVVNATLRGKGNAGDININSRTALIDKGGAVFSISFDEGNGGNVNIKSDKLTIRGGIYDEADQGFIPSSIATSNAGAGDGKKTSINVNTLELQNGGRIDASTFQSGNSGDIEINARDITLSGRDPDAGTPSSIQSASDVLNNVISDLFEVQSPPTGKAGSIQITGETLELKDGSFISVRSIGKGESGSLAFDNNFISIDNRSFISASTNDDSGGNIAIKSDFISLQRGSFIEANSENQFGGNISLTTDTLLAGPSTSITASSNRGTNFDGSIETDIQNTQPIKTIKLASLRPINTEISQICGFDGNRLSNTSKADFETITGNPNLIAAWDIQQRYLTHKGKYFRDIKTGKIKPMRPVLALEYMDNGEIRSIYEPDESEYVLNLISSLERKCSELRST